mgnify:CR=1 FL=1
MEDLFRSYWWLLFPLAWFISTGFSSLLDHSRERDRLKLSLAAESHRRGASTGDDGADYPMKTRAKGSRDEG